MRTFIRRLPQRFMMLVSVALLFGTAILSLYAFYHVYKGDHTPMPAAPTVSIAPAPSLP